MSGASSNAVAWFALLEPAIPVPVPQERHADDPRLGEVIECWQGDGRALIPGRAVLVGFPQDEGVRRNRGRPGAAAAPNEIRRFLYRLTPWDGFNDNDLTAVPPLDAGNLAVHGSLEETQQALAAVVAGILSAGAIPIVLGGGHETAFGHYLGYVKAGCRVGIINLDAHLDVRPWTLEGGHSGSPFRQAMEHPDGPLPGHRYVCLGAQPQSVSREHLDFVRRRGGRVIWANEVNQGLDGTFERELDRLHRDGCQVYVSIDADVVNAAEVPGVSAPNLLGLPGKDVLACARLAGLSAAVSSIDLVEINPAHDRDGQSARWGGLAVWQFLMGLAKRTSQRR